MAISAAEAIGPAIERTKRVLFKPFDLGKWFVLGFCAWLASLGEGGGGGGGGQSWSSHSGGGGGGEFVHFLDPVLSWVEANWVIVVLLAVVVFLVLVAIGLVLTWIRSRGKFMFLDGVVRNRGAVVEPWRQFRQVGNSLFWFQVVLGLIGLVGFVGIAGLGAAIAWPDIQAEHFDGWAVAALAVSLPLFVLFGLTMAVIGLLLEDFVIPVMYLRGVPTLWAWGVFRREILAGHVGAIVLFYLLKIVLVMAIGIIACAATCLTCCLVALPYLGTVILLPLIVFGRSYSLCFLEQFGEPWRFFREAAVPAGPTGPVPPVPEA